MTNSTLSSVPRIESLHHCLQTDNGPDGEPLALLDELMVFLEDPPPDIRDRWKSGAEFCAAHNGTFHEMTKRENPSSIKAMKVCVPKIETPHGAGKRKFSFWSGEELFSFRSGGMKVLMCVTCSLIESWDLFTSWHGPSR